MTKLHLRPRGWACLTALLALTTLSHAQTGCLNNEVARAVSARKLGEARIGISILDADTGEALASVHASDAFTPASNMKLLTSGAALLVLGPDFSFRTEVIRDGDRLIIKGAGDPALADPEILKESQPPLTVSDVLAALASAATKAGMNDVKEDRRRRPRL